MAGTIRCEDLQVVAYRKVTIYYKVHAPTLEAVEDWEHDFLDGGGYSLRRAITNQNKQRRNGVIVQHTLDMVTTEGVDPWE